MASQTFFGIQIALPGEALRRRFYELIGPGGVEPAQNLGDKRVFYDRLVDLLRESHGAFALGYWDYITDPQKAQNEFDTWCSEVEMAAYDIPDEPRGAMFTLTMLFLVDAGSNSDHTLAKRCDIPQHEYFTRETFKHLIDTIPMFSFSTVRADAVYLIPGTHAEGYSIETLRGDGYEYLNELR
jgi:hypothetical protein